MRGTDGRPIGRLADLSLRLRADSPVIDRVVVSRFGARTLILPWAVTAFENDHVVCGIGAAELVRFEVGTVADALESDEILLKRDVLDTQIVDVVGQRLARVADVVLARTPDGRLAALGVQVGFGAVLRRLRLPGGAVGNDLVAWSDLHLTSERGHQVQLATPRAAVHRLDVRGLAALVSRVDTDSAGEILAGREPALAAEVVRSADPEIGEGVLRAMPEHQSRRIVAAMPREYAVRWRNRLRRRRGRRFLRSRVSARRHLNWPRR